MAALRSSSSSTLSYAASRSQPSSAVETLGSVAARGPIGGDPERVHRTVIRTGWRRHGYLADDRREFAQIRDDGAQVLLVPVGGVVPDHPCQGSVRPSQGDSASDGTHDTGGLIAGGITAPQGTEGARTNQPKPR